MRLLRKIGATAIAIIALPIATIAGLFSKGRNCTPIQLAADLRELSEGRKGAYGWDEMECVPLKDPRLEAIRLEAIRMAWSLKPEDLLKLKEFADRAEAIPAQHPSTSSG